MDNFPVSFYVSFGGKRMFCKANYQNAISLLISENGIKHDSSLLYYTKKSYTL